MKQSEINVLKAATVLALSIIFSGCAVIKTPYFKTDYYLKTTSRLEKLSEKHISEKDTLYAGFSKVSITPFINNPHDNPENGSFKKVPIAGFGQIKQKIATGVHDSIFVKAVALKAGGETCIIISADMLIMPPNIIDSVTTSVAKKGINRGQLFFTSTHSHSSIGGWGYGILARLMAGKENKSIEKWITWKITEAVLKSIEDLQKATIGKGSFNGAGFIRNRLTGDQSQNNNDFNFLVIKLTDGRKAIIGSFSAHATTISSKNTLLSGDYPGYWERKVEEKSADVAIFCSGSMGSQSPVGKGSQYENARFIGESLADSLSNHFKGITMTDKLILKSLSLKILLPDYHFRFTKNINLTTGLSDRLMPEPEDVYLQALRINNLIWFFTPGDFSGESALMIKNLVAGKGYEAVVSGYNGSYVGYIIPGKYFYLKNYETVGMGWFGPTMGDYIFDLMIKMSNSLILNK